jgi:uncharacterized membrane protein YfcA
MEYIYNKKHTRISTSAGMAIGIIFGVWLGNRSSVSGLFEEIIAFMVFFISINIVFSQIDKKYLPTTQTDSKELVK